MAAWSGDQNRKTIVCEGGLLRFRARGVLKSQSEGMAHTDSTADVSSGDWEFSKSSHPQLPLPDFFFLQITVTC